MSDQTLHDPLAVNTAKDEACWMRRAYDREGHGLYALADSTEPFPSLWTIRELAERGLRGMVNALPMPVSPGLRTLDVVEHELTGASLALYEEELETARLRLALASAQRGRRQQREQVAALRDERHTTNEALADVAVALREREAAPFTVFRAAHDAIPMGLYSTAAAAREQCEALVRRDWPDNNIDWIDDEDDGVSELTVWVRGEEFTTGYVVTELEVATTYDAEADE
jgi:hypothetical protein